MERTLFPKGKDAKGRPYESYRWSRLKNLAPAEMYTIVGEHVFSFLRELGGELGRYAIDRGVIVRGDVDLKLAIQGVVVP